MEETDMISELPDCLLHRILYFVGMVYAVRTCVLSKRWRYLWTSMPCLYFPGSVRLSEYKGRRDFVKFIDKVMSVLNSSNTRIHTIIIDNSCLQDCISSDVMENLLDSLVQHSIVVLDITIVPHYMIKLPHSLFNCKSLEKLSLCLNQPLIHFDGGGQNLITLPLGSIDLPALRTLRLERLMFAAKEINNLISRCSALETLVISSCALFGYKNLIVNAPQLKRLEVQNWVLENVTVTAITPNLTTFKFKCIQLHKVGSFSLSNMISPMVEAEMDFLGCRNAIDFDCFKLLPSVRSGLADVSKVKALSLKLPGRLFQAILDPPAQGCYFATSFCEVRILKLTTFAERQGRRARSHLLEMCPNLETLVLRVINPRDEDFIEMKLPPKCISHHLKFVKIMGDTSSLEDEFAFVKFLLMNALVLETLSFQHKCYNDLYNDTSRILEFAKEVKAIARASPNVKISLFNELFCM